MCKPSSDMINLFKDQLDQKMEEHRLKTAKGFYQEERKRAETLLDTQRTAWGMPTLAEESAHTNTSSEPAFWARILAEKGFADFGFVLFRLDYTNQSRWDAWFRTFDDIAEASMDATTRRSDVEVELV